MLQWQGAWLRGRDVGSGSDRAAGVAEPRPPSCVRPLIGKLIAWLRPIVHLRAIPLLSCLCPPTHPLVWHLSHAHRMTTVMG